MRTKNIYPFEHKIKKEHRQKKYNHESFVVWFTGLSGSGKSTIASRVEEELFKKGLKTYILDADNIRNGLNKGLGFSDEDRFENLRRVGEVAKLFVDAGLIVLATFISPKKKEREYVKSLFQEGEFIEVFVNCPLEECEKRDAKGIYAKYRRGEINDFVGIDIEFEKPDNPNITLNTSELNIEESVSSVIENIQEKICLKEKSDI